MKEPVERVDLAALPMTELISELGATRHMLGRWWSMTLALG